jgi:hypothetical protein
MKNTVSSNARFSKHTHLLHLEPTQAHAGLFILYALLQKYQQSNVSAITNVLDK